MENSLQSSIQRLNDLKFSCLFYRTRTNKLEFNKNKKKINKKNIRVMSHKSLLNLHLWKKKKHFTDWKKHFFINYRTSTHSRNSWICGWNVEATFDMLGITSKENIFEYWKLDQKKYLLCWELDQKNEIDLVLKPLMP